MTANKPTLDDKKSGRLLAKITPKAIETEEQYENYCSIAEQLIDQGEEISNEEAALLKLLAILIEDYEKDKYLLPIAPPKAVLKELIDSRGLKPSDLWELFGSKGLLSDVLSGRRPISRIMAIKLGQFFNVPPGMFIG